MQRTKRVTYTSSHGYPKGILHIILQSLFEIPMQKDSTSKILQKTPKL